jgi:hypothetical protein
MARARGLLPLLVLAALFLGACDDGGGSAPPELADLALRLDDARIDAGTPDVGPAPGATPDGKGDSPSSPVGTIVTIGATGGDGVSLRSGCSAGARIDGGWPDSTEVAVIEVGVDECAGWTRVEAAGVVSWVSDQYLPGLGAGRPAPAAAGEASEQPPEAAAVRAWIAALDEASSRVALIARAATASSMPYEAEFLRVIEGDLGVLQAGIVDSPVATSGAVCAVAAGALADAAVTLRLAAGRLAVLFDEWPATPYPAEVDRLAGQYAALVAEAGAEAAACIDAA